MSTTKQKHRTRCSSEHQNNTNKTWNKLRGILHRLVITSPPLTCPCSIIVSAVHSMVPPGAREGDESKGGSHAIVTPLAASVEDEVPVTRTDSTSSTVTVTYTRRCGGGKRKNIIRVPVPRLLILSHEALIRITPTLALPGGGELLVVTCFSPARGGRCKDAGGTPQMVCSGIAFETPA